VPVISILYILILEPRLSEEIKLLSTVPVLASLDIKRSADFFATRLGFKTIYAESGAYGVVERGGCQIHFWFCSEKHIAENTSCRINMNGIRVLYAEATSYGIVHPNGKLEKKPWDTQEFTILDLDGNAVVFVELGDHV
jgi:hypothetical protein